VLLLRAWRSAFLQRARGWALKWGGSTPTWTEWTESRRMSRNARASASVATADASLASHDELYTSELLGFSLERLAKVQLPSAFHSAGTDPYSSMAHVLGTCYKYAGARVVARRRGPLAASNPGACSEPVWCLHRGRGVHFCRHEGGCVGGRACAGSTTGAHQRQASRCLL
jgi:hypothetical protein